VFLLLSDRAHPITSAWPSLYSLARGSATQLARNRAACRPS